eukprot:scaffold838_cov209-Alexandrium_tamarense.AAC.2
MVRIKLEEANGLERPRRLVALCSLLVVVCNILEDEESSTKVQHQRVSSIREGNRQSHATECYEVSIRSAREHRFIHEEALACESTGYFFEEQEEKE